MRTIYSSNEILHSTHASLDTRLLADIVVLYSV
jgi:hypothetical protein